MEIIVFTNNGKTLKFDNVSNFEPETSGFNFDYVGKSTGVSRKARFDYTSVSGYATRISDGNVEKSDLIEEYYKQLVQKDKE